MLEYWNVEDPVFSGDGIMGSGKMDKCCNGEIHLDTEVINALK